MDPLEAEDPAATPWVDPSAETATMPRWVLRAITIFWLGFIATLVGRWLFSRLHTLLFLIAVSFFLSLAIEPGVNFLARRGWRRGVATALFLLGITLASLLFVGAIGALIGRQVANFIDDLPAADHRGAGLRQPQLLHRARLRRADRPDRHGRSWRARWPTARSH